MSISNIVYVIAISFQISGAVLLLINNFHFLRTKVIKAFFNASTFTCVLDKKLKMNNESFKEFWMRNIYSILAFVYIIGGYITGVFGHSEECKLLIALLIICLSAAIILLSIFIVKLLFKHGKKFNQKISLKEVKELGINPDMEEMNEEELAELFDILS